MRINKTKFKKIKRNEKEIFFELNINNEIQKRGYITHRISAYAQDRSDIKTKKNLLIGYIDISYIDKNIYKKLYENSKIKNIMLLVNFNGLTLSTPDKTNELYVFSKENLKLISWYYWSKKDYIKANKKQNEIDKINEKDFFKIKKEIKEINDLLKDDALKVENYLKILINQPFVDFIKSVEKEYIENKFDIPEDLADFYKQGIAIELYKNAALFCTKNNFSLRKGYTNTKSQKIWDNYLSCSDFFEYKKDKNGNEYIKMKKLKIKNNL